VPEKRVQSFAFYMGDAQPKNAEKGVGWGETPHASSSQKTLEGHSRSFAHPKPYIQNDRRDEIYNPVPFDF
jgi:hypothetical protein